MTDAELDALFTREGLRPFQPRPGATGFTPMLDVLGTDAHGKTVAQVYALALGGFNDADTRRQILANLGARCAFDGLDVDVVRLGAEVWMRTFTPEEARARGTRLVETYDDKSEGMTVMALTADGRTRMATAPLYRRPHGEVERLGDWRVAGPQERVQALLLEVFWQGYRAAREAKEETL